MESKEIMAIIKKPGEKAEIKPIRNTIEELQEIVGGYIETLKWTNDSVLIMNEEGKLLGLPVNFPIWNDVIVGTAVVVGTKEDEFTDVPLDAIEAFSACVEDRR